MFLVTELCTCSRPGCCSDNKFPFDRLGRFWIEFTGYIDGIYFYSTAPLGLELSNLID